MTSIGSQGPPPHAGVLNEPTTESEGGEQTAQHLADIAQLLLIPGTVADALRRIVLLALAAIDGCDEAGLCGGPLLQGQIAPVSELVAKLEELQSAAQEGPCIETLAGVDSVYVVDLAEDQRWPSFAPAAVELGVRSALGYRLSAGGTTVGALLLYARLPGAFNAADRAQGLIFASYAAMALAQAQTQAADHLRIEHLESALLSREVIGQAQGILMERERITAEQAFHLLRRASQHLNLKLRHVAQGIVDTGDVPHRS